MIVASAFLIGCGSNEPSPEPTAAEKQTISQSTTTWTPDKIDAFKKAHERARSGADNDGPPTSSGQKSK
ncbi:MAG: hypothetical protein JST51_19120 [Armatimonadetes bacterium]|nr:hypothetical protein [Armatimonadota bacterium]